MANATDIAIRTFLEQAIADKGLNTRSLSLKARLARNTVYRAVQSPTRTRLSTLMKLCKALDADLTIELRGRK